MQLVSLLNSLVIYGPLGIGCFALGIWIIFLNKYHKKERDEWRSQSRDQFDTIVELIRTSTATVESLKATLESMEKSMWGQ